MDQHNWITIPDTQKGYPLNQFIIPSHYTADLDSILIPHGLIMDRIAKLAKDIASTTNSPLTLICILKGGHTFFAHLLEFLKRETDIHGKNLPIQLEFVKVKSYTNTTSSEKVDISLTQSELNAFHGKHILLVEDIVDTGKTMVALLDVFRQNAHPASLKVVTLFKKRTPLSNGYTPDFVGFEIPDLFIVGYALDYNEYFRDLDHVCVISDAGMKKYAV